MSRGEFCVAMLGLLGATTCKNSAPKGESQHSAPAQPAAPSAPPPPPSSTPVSSGGISLRRLGHTGAMVSMLGLGGAHIGRKEKLSEDESIRLIREAIDGGITFMDNCWDYNDGRSEVRMGKALRDGYRNRVFLMTKIDGRTKSAADAQLDQSLKRLQTEVIDLVQIHEVIRPTDPERAFAPGGVVTALQAAKKAGKIRFIGFTGHKSPDIHLSMLEEAKQHDFVFDTVQMPLNVMDAHFRSFERAVLPVLIEQGVGVLGMKSMGSGDILDSKIVTPEECLRYALSLPTSVVITGIDSRAVLQQDLRVARTFTPLSPEERKTLLDRTASAASSGELEQFKVGQKYDGTGKNPRWLDSAEL